MLKQEQKDFSAEAERTNLPFLCLFVLWILSALVDAHSIDAGIVLYSVY